VLSRFIVSRGGLRDANDAMKRQANRGMRIADRSCGCSMRVTDFRICMALFKWPGDDRVTGFHSGEWEVQRCTLPIHSFEMNGEHI